MGSIPTTELIDQVERSFLCATNDKEDLKRIPLLQEFENEMKIYQVSRALFVDSFHCNSGKGLSIRSILPARLLERPMDSYRSPFHQTNPDQSRAQMALEILRLSSPSGRLDLSQQLSSQPSLPIDNRIIESRR